MNIYIAFSLFSLIILLYWVITELFTIFFRFTGLPEEKARFQVISLLTGCGFTTRESEMILSNRRRRRLARITMLFGYVFNITIVSAFINVFLSLKVAQVEDYLLVVLIPLAVIAINLSDLDPATKKQIKIATLGNSDYLKVGEPAIAIGNALGTGQSVTTGVISAVNRAYTDDEGPLYGTETDKASSSSAVKYLIQTDAAINPGNSGGALLNVRGEVVGINSSKIADYATEGMGYAIPISTAEPILKDLMEKKTRPSQKNDSATYLGISGMAVTGELLDKYDIKEGIYITQVFDHTPAKDAGIHKGDILLEIDGYTVGKMSDLTEVLSYYKIGEKVTAKLMTRTNNGYQPYETTVTLGGK